MANRRDLQAAVGLLSLLVAGSMVFVAVPKRDWRFLCLGLGFLIIILIGQAGADCQKFLKSISPDPRTFESKEISDFVVTRDCSADLRGPLERGADTIGRFGVWPVVKHHSL